MIITKYSKFLESKSHDIWNIIPDSIKSLHKMFKESGYSLYLVGGSVRDFLNNETPKDFDLATDATPDEVLSVIGRKYKTNLQGKSFGVVVVYTEDQPKGIEIATFREDQYNDKLGVTRNPDVKFSTIEKDVERRDIPYNALFYDLEKREIIDLVGGVNDIKNKTTKFVGDAELRIEEDPLRILRLLRFNSRYQFNIDTKTSDAIKKNKSKLKIISKERIWAFSGENTGEIMKAWKQAKNFTEYLELFNSFNLWEDIFPNLKVNTEIKNSEYLEIYLANILKYNNISNLSNRLIQELKIETEWVRKIIFLISILDISVEKIMDLYKARKVAIVSKDVIEEWFSINNINDKTSLFFINYTPSVSSHELIKKGFSGKELGDEIKRLEIEKIKMSINED